jgi:predicted ribosomally synthesized peptide with nif11-like leader
MSAEGTRGLVERLNANAAFRARFDAAATAQERHKLATDAGYDVTQDELSELTPSGVRQLADEELADVSGGDMQVGGYEITTRHRP